MPETVLVNDREYASYEGAILSTRSISLASNPDESAGTGAVFAATGARMPARQRVSCGLANWTVSVTNAALPLPAWFFPSVNTLIGLLDLPPGWNSYSAKRIARHNVLATIKLMGGLLDFDTPAPTVVPRVQGNIQLEWHTDHIDLEIYIDSPDNVRFFAEDVTKEQVTEGTLTDREEELRAWLKLLASD